MFSSELAIDPIIVALDFPSASDADAMVDALGPSVAFYKVGMELYAAAGMEYVKRLQASGKQVFLDLKFYDIGETVKRAVEQVANSGAAFLTVHAVPQVVRAAVEGRRDSSLKILAVTVLTSLGQDDISEDGYHLALHELVALRARNALACGADGLVASPLEVAALRRAGGPKPVLVTPGVRSPGAAQADQKRVATPAEAIRDGASYLVIGREVTRARDPLAAVSRIRHDISEAVPV